VFSWAEWGKKYFSLAAVSTRTRDLGKISLQMLLRRERPQSSPKFSFEGMKDKISIPLQNRN